MKIKDDTDLARTIKKCKRNGKWLIMTEICEIINY